MTPSDSCVSPTDDCADDLVTPTDDHVTTTSDHVIDLPGPTLTPSTNLKMKQLPDTTLSLPTSSTFTSSLEEPPRSSSSLRPPADHKHTRPHSITLPASKMTEGTRKSLAVPDITLTDDFGDCFASLPNGMVKVSVGNNLVLQVYSTLCSLHVGYWYPESGAPHTI